jgi:hypothetical protein
LIKTLRKILLPFKELPTLLIIACTTLWPLYTLGTIDRNISEEVQKVLILDDLLDDQDSLYQIGDINELAKVRYRIASLLYELGIFEESLLYLNEVLSPSINISDDINKSAGVRKARILQELGRFKDLKPIVDSRIDSKIPELQFIIGSYYLDQSNFSAAQTYISRLSSTKSESTFAQNYYQFLIAKEMLVNQNYQGAMAGFIRLKNNSNWLMEKDPLLLLNVVKSLSNLYAQLGDYKSAFQANQTVDQMENKLYDRSISHNFYTNEKAHRIAMIKEKSRLEKEVLENALKVEQKELHFAVAIGTLLIFLVGVLAFEIWQRIKYSRALNEKNVKILKQKATLQDQSKNLQEINDEITQINENLESLVQERSAELLKQNTKLEEYAFINGHKLRAPVARIKGLAQLVDISDDIEEKHIIIEKMMEEVNELDELVTIIRNALEGQKELDRSLLDSKSAEKAYIPSHKLN